MSFVGKPVLLRSGDGLVIDSDTIQYLSYNESEDKKLDRLVESSMKVELTDLKASRTLNTGLQLRLTRLKKTKPNHLVPCSSSSTMTMAMEATICLRHTQLGYSVVLIVRDHYFHTYLYLIPGRVPGEKFFKVIEWDKLVIFPKHVAFKGDNGSYLKAKTIEDHPYLKFEAKDIGDPTVGHEVFLNRDGSLRIKSIARGKFWKLSPSWIWCDAAYEKSYHDDSLFKPVKLGSNVVALRNQRNKSYCARLTTEGKEDCLNASMGSVVNEARLVVEEHALSRIINDVDFHLDRARIDIKEVILGMSSKLVNSSKNGKSSTMVKLSYQESKSKTWSSSVSLSLGVKTTFEVGIPLVANGKIEISAVSTGTYEWGEVDTTIRTVEASTTVVVPPGSKKRLIVVANKGVCEIPFSYRQRDHLTNGLFMEEEKHDGLYNGINYYEITTKIVDVL
ncbi:hypothetical protein Syun_024032 [Stephania yunnanensis]|uniref:Agglutinin domain-containing protein n=1 Tax=Stephania yunnanensis TaxID=152371 RepID=A0AAP0FA39_9MAGN